MPADGRLRVTVLGSTGSIGRNTVDLLLHQGGAEAYDVVALTGASNVGLLARQARQLGARLAVTADPARLGELRHHLAGSGIEAAAGDDAVAAAAAEPCDWTMAAIIGLAGLAPTLKAAERGGVLALANKESLVAAGPALMEICARHNSRLIPTDSEHSAIFQALAGHAPADLDRIILTASGGPFRNFTADELAGVTPAMARTHPNWVMGERITVDSASMFNKALELIETHHLFGAAPDRIEVIIHPQSIVHSMVGFRDGTILAQLGPPDMKAAIGYALNWPERRPLPIERLDFARLARLDFLPADEARFPALRLAREVMARGGLAGAAFIAAKDRALDLFLAGRLAFTAMATLVEKTLDALPEQSQSGHDLPILQATRTTSAWAAQRLEELAAGM